MFKDIFAYRINCNELYEKRLSFDNLKLILDSCPTASLAIFNKVGEKYFYIIDFYKTLKISNKYILIDNYKTRPLIFQYQKRDFIRIKENKQKYYSCSIIYRSSIKFDIALYHQKLEIKDVILSLSEKL